MSGMNSNKAVAFFGSIVGGISALMVPVSIASNNAGDSAFFTATTIILLGLSFHLLARDGKSK